MLVYVHSFLQNALPVYSSQLNCCVVDKVVKVFDHKLRTNVALKIVRNEKRFHKQAQEEIRILKHLRQQVGRHETFSAINFIVDLSAVFKVISLMWS